MKISIITLFPDMFRGPFAMSMLKKAQDIDKVTIDLVNLRDYGLGSRKQVDDVPYGGGDGMVLKPEPVYAAVEAVKSKVKSLQSKPKSSTLDIQHPTVVLLTPQGKTYHQALARKLSKKQHLILICGHYEGFDERIRQLADLELSIGDYVLTGGEIPAMVVVDSVVRLIPGVLGGVASAQEESFSSGKTLEYPQYTRPEVFKGIKVPSVLLSGHHAKIAKWRQEQAKKRTNKIID